jgi:hypothetical protein
MIVGIVVLWAGYTIGLWGYTLIRGYCVTPANLLNYKFPAAAGQPATAQGSAAANPVTPGSQAGSQVAAGGIRPQG